MLRYIVGMAADRNTIISKLSDSTSQLDKHLIKMMLYPNSPSLPHWGDEIYSFLNETYKWKKTNRFLKYPQIRSALAIDEDILDNYIVQVRDMYKDNASADIQDKDIIEKVVLYHDWIAQELSQRGIVTRSDVEAALLDLKIDTRQ